MNLKSTFAAMKAIAAARSAVARRGINTRTLSPQDIATTDLSNAHGTHVVYRAKDGGPINFGSNAAKRAIAAAKATRKAERRAAKKAHP